MIKYRHKNMEFEKAQSNPGERYKVEYQLKITKEGEMQLEPCGQTDLQQFIDSHEPSINLQNILDRYRNGDVNALERAKAFYADISDLPVNLHDVVNMNMEAERFFESLPVDVKNKLGDNYYDFLFNPGKLIEALENRGTQKVEVEKAEFKEIVEDEQPQ